jgi:hypothetical protein
MQTIMDKDVTQVQKIIRAEYLEMPGLCLTAAQMQRLWNLSPSTCKAVVTNLVTGGFLRVTDDGEYLLGQSAKRRVAVAALH